MAETTSFNSVAKARERIGVIQKALAAMLRRDDGTSFSPQYLNDIEHDRRSPSTDWLVSQLSIVLGLDLYSMYFSAGRIPPDLMAMNSLPETVALAMAVLRSKID